MSKAYFENIKREIIPLLDHAQKQVNVAMAWFTNQEFLDALISCLHRDVNVELVLLDDPINWTPYAPDFNKFISNGGILHIASTGSKFMHNKFCVIDNQCVITGSYNWTYYAETRNLENVIITQHSGLIAQYQRCFAKLLKFFPRSAKAPKLTWENVGAYETIDFDELNYEVSSIAQARNLPIPIIVPSKISIIDQPLVPKANFSIALCTDDGFIDFIKEGDKLPAISKVKRMNSYSDKRSRLRFVLGRYKKSGNASQEKTLLDRPITDITAGRTDHLLHIDVQITLLSDAHLNATIRCVETGKTINLSTSDQKLVTYES